MISLIIIFFATALVFILSFLLLKKRQSGLTYRIVFSLLISGGTGIVLLIVVPGLFGQKAYFSQIFRKTPYNFSDFEYFTIEYGPGDSLVNKYNSKTGGYQFLNSHDALVKENVHLPTEDLLYIHWKIDELGFWNFPAVEMGDTTQKISGEKPLRYRITFHYKTKSKVVTFDESYDADPALRDANKRIIREIMKVLDSEESPDKN
ncbi:MAG: hypothetical protein JST19_09445 [Bacteroidetes bacterium]|nr:hypothetical protein [Bacteroidota bacterium]